MSLSHCKALNKLSGPLLYVFSSWVIHFPWETQGEEAVLGSTAKEDKAVPKFRGAHPNEEDFSPQTNNPDICQDELHLCESATISGNCNGTKSNVLNTQRDGS